MVTIMIHATVKAELLQDFEKIASELTSVARKNPECFSYTFNQRTDKPTEFLLYEQWASQTALDGHIENLIDLLGPPKPGGLLPEKLTSFYEKAVPRYYNVVGPSE